MFDAQTAWFFLVLAAGFFLLRSAYRIRIVDEAPQPQKQPAPRVFLEDGEALPDHISAEERATRIRYIDEINAPRLQTLMERFGHGLDSSTTEALRDDFNRRLRAEYGVAA